MNQREASRQNWSVRSDDGRATREEIDSGSLQRIADATERMTNATEKMAKNHSELIAELERYKGYYESRGRRINQLEKEVVIQKRKATYFKNKWKKLK